MRTKITNILLMPGVRNEAHIPFIRDAEVLIENSRIVFAGKKSEAPAFEADQVIDGEGQLCMPGLCNTHTHTPMTLMRSLGSDLPLSNWLTDVVFPMEKHLTADCVKAGTELGVLEMLRFGTTAFNDMYFHMDEVAQVVVESGMRAMLGYGVVDFDESCRDLQPGIEFARRWSHKADDRIRVSIDPHAINTTTKKLLQQVREVTEEGKFSIHMHVSETKADTEFCQSRYGMSIPKFLDSLGLLDLPFTAAHCVWMDDEDIALFAEKGVFILHNPVSNLKLSSGIAPIAKMLSAGCKVTLGTDGVASNNNLNLWEEIHLMPLLQKGTTLDPTVVSPAQTIAAATSIGAEALGYSDAGLLKEGYRADLILVDLSAAHMIPCHDLESNLVYCTQGSDVKLTMVDGKVLYHNGKFLTLDEKLVKERAAKEGAQLLERCEKAGTKIL